mgnify:CR=1 FL=1|tara:strand:- start:89 stop:745 length:657 start_codon:yes stop_codon:yes gene_type:complete
MADKSKGEVEIHGSTYLTVARRVDDFRKSEDFKGWSIETELVSAEDSMVVMKSTIRDGDGKVAATGYAEEDRSFGKINKTSALENCETSAVGRSLAFLGLGGSEIASADEVAGAINQQKQMEADEHLLAHANATHKYFDDIVAIKEGIANDDFISAGGAWFDLHNKASEEELQALKRARNKGGIWSTHETGLLRADGEVSKVKASMIKQELTMKETAA